MSVVGPLPLHRPSRFLVGEPSTPSVVAEMSSTNPEESLCTCSQEIDHDGREDTSND
jgi:hypothetical protein